MQTGTTPFRTACPRPSRRPARSRRSTALLDRFAFVVFFEVPDALPCGSFVSTFDKRSRPLSTLCVNWLMKLWPSKSGTSRLSGGKTTQSTLLAVNGPTRTVEIVINFAAVTPPVASCNWTVGSLGWGFRPIFAANSAESVTRLAPVSKIIGVVTLPFKVTSTSKTPPFRLISTALLSTDFSRFTSCFTLSSNPRDGPSLSGDFDFEFRASRADLIVSSWASSAYRRLVESTSSRRSRIAWM